MEAADDAMEGDGDGSSNGQEIEDDEEYELVGVSNLFF